MDRSDASALADLQMHWDEAYVIGLDGEVWSARYSTSADELRAHTSTELRELIRSDYAYRQKTGRTADDLDEYEDADVAGDGDTDDDGDAEYDADAEEDADADPEDDADADADAAAAASAAPDKAVTLDDVDDKRGNDAFRGRRDDVEESNFATIRGERMST